MGKVHYDPSNDEQLCEMVNNGNVTKDAIRALGTTGTAARRRARKITAGNNLRYTIPMPWTAEETAKLQQLLAEGLSAAEIAVKLCRSEGCIYWHIKLEGGDPCEIAEVRAARKRSEKNRRLLPANKIDMTPRKCPTCGKMFIPAKNATIRVFCSYTCRVLYHDSHGDYQRPMHTFTCAHCGKLVEAYGDDKRQKFCGPHCEKLYWKHPRKKEE